MVNCSLPLPGPQGPGSWPCPSSRSLAPPSMGAVGLELGLGRAVLLHAWAGQVMSARDKSLHPCVSPQEHAGLRHCGVPACPGAMAMGLRLRCPVTMKEQRKGWRGPWSGRGISCSAPRAGLGGLADPPWAQALLRNVDQIPPPGDPWPPAASRANVSSPTPGDVVY